MRSPWAVVAAIVIAAVLLFGAWRFLSGPGASPSPSSSTTASATPGGSPSAKPTASATPPASATASAAPAGAGSIAFVRQSSTTSAIEVIGADGSALAALTSGTGDFYPSWSPDTARIAFARRIAGSDNKHIFVMNRDGSAVTQLTTGPADDGSPAWSPDGNKIAFSREGVVYVMASDGSGVAQLVKGGDWSDVSPSWSPDGTKLAFVRFLPGEGTPGDVYVANADGSDPRQLTDLSSVGSVAWSPDGTRLAFFTGTCCADTATTLVNVINADGSGATQLTQPQDQASAPTWSPDSTRLAFVRRVGDKGEIWIMNADGTGTTRLTGGADQAANDSEPAWR